MENKKKIKLGIVDDHQIVIDGLHSLLTGNPEISIEFSTTDASSVVKLINATGINLLLTDIMMEPMNGVALAKKVHEAFPEIKILALSMSGAGDMVDEMISNDSIQGYVLKNIGRQELISAIQKIAGGGIYYSDEILESLALQSEKKKLPAAAKLTIREIEIIKLIVEEKNNRAIAAQLFISERTVETHRKNIFRKIGINSVIGVIKYAYENKLVKR